MNFAASFRPQQHPRSSTAQRRKLCGEYGRPAGDSEFRKRASSRCQEPPPGATGSTNVTPSGPVLLPDCRWPLREKRRLGRRSGRISHDRGWAGSGLVSRRSCTGIRRAGRCASRIARSVPRLRSAFRGLRVHRWRPRRLAVGEIVTITARRSAFPCHSRYDRSGSSGRNQHNLPRLATIIALSPVDKRGQPPSGSAADPWGRCRGS